MWWIGGGIFSDPPSFFEPELEKNWGIEACSICCRAYWLYFPDWEFIMISYFSCMKRDLQKMSTWKSDLYSAIDTMKAMKSGLRHLHWQWLSCFCGICYKFLLSCIVFIWECASCYKYADCMAGMIGMTDMLLFPFSISPTRRTHLPIRALQEEWGSPDAFVQFLDSAWICLDWFAGFSSQPYLDNSEVQNNVKQGNL